MSDKKRENWLTLAKATVIAALIGLAGVIITVIVVAVSKLPPQPSPLVSELRITLPKNNSRVDDPCEVVFESDVTNKANIHYVIVTPLKSGSHYVTRVKTPGRIAKQIVQIGDATSEDEEPYEIRILTTTNELSDGVQSLDLPDRIDSEPVIITRKINQP